MEITLNSHPKNLKEIRKKMENFCFKAGFAAEDTRCIVFAVDEACSNIIRHCYQMDVSKKIILQGEDFQDRIEFHIRDFGPPVDPSSFIQDKKDLLDPGGLGCKAIREVMDKVEYSSRKDKGTDLFMVRFKKG